MIYLLRELQIRNRGFCVSSGLLTAGGAAQVGAAPPKGPALRILLSKPGLASTLLALRPGADYFIMKLS